MILSFDELHEIHRRAVAVGLHNKREQMLFGVSIEYVAALDVSDNPNSQLLSDLFAMDAVGTIVGGVVPLERWLRNAAYAMSVRPDHLKFFREFADKAAKATQPAEERQPAGMQQERILFISDMLPFGFLAGAARTGRSVARLAVPRFEAGQPVNHSASNNPMLFYGTGWLIGPKHIITNHHVVNARTEGRRRR